MEAARALFRVVSHFSVLGSVIAALVGAAQPGCSSKGLSGRRGHVSAPEGTSQSALSTTTNFAIYAENSADLRDRVEVHGGDVGVKQTGNNPTLENGYELVFSSDAHTDTDKIIYANRLQLWDRATVGPIQVNHLDVPHLNATHGQQNSFPTVVPNLPPLAAVSPGTTALNVTANTPIANPGSYGAVSVGNAVTWKLTSGVYHLASLHIEDDARVEVLGPVQLRIAGRLDGLDRTWIVPAPGVNMTAGELRIEVSGQNGASGSITDWPKSAQFGTEAHVSGVMLVPNGTLRFGARATLNGAYLAKDIYIDNDGKVYFQSGVGPSGCLQSCDDHLACTVDACTNGTCTHSNVAPGTGCTDGNACNGAETCDGAGQCLPGTPPPPCEAPDQCHTLGTCDPTTGLCINPVKDDGSGCDDGDACTENDVCSQGSCAGVAKTCAPPPNTQCYEPSTCVEGVCSHAQKPLGTPCDDGKECTSHDRCDENGSCSGETICNTPPNTQCFEATGTCEDTGCSYKQKAIGAACDDGSAGSREDWCHSGGTCAGASLEGKLVPQDGNDTVQSELPGSFAVSQAGAATYTIPLDIPEGRAGMTPQLALSYSSNSGDGLLGIGWSLSGAMSQIAPCRKAIALDGEAEPPDYQNACFPSGLCLTRYCLDGEPLVENGSRLGTFEYRPEHDPSTRVMMKVESGAPKSFLVEMADGRKLYYDTQVYVPQVTVVADQKSFDPTTLSQTMRQGVWLLSRISDIAGNSISVSYTISDNEIVPKEIAYTSFVKDNTVTEQPLRKISFEYGGRPDPSGAWANGVLTTSTKLLKRINISGPNPLVPGLLFYYELAYKNDSVSGRSLLRSVKECTADNLCKPATTFDWEKGAATFTNVGSVLYGPMYEGVKLIDINGDGRIDRIVLRTGSPGTERTVYYGLARTDCEDAICGWDLRVAEITGVTSENAITPIDIDGDGASELVVRRTENGKDWLRYYRFDGSKWNQIPDEGNEVEVPYGPLYIYVADLDGDGLPELVRPVDGTWKFRKNNGGSLGPYALLGPPDGDGGTYSMSASWAFNNFVGDLDGSGRHSILLMPRGGAYTSVRYTSIHFSRQSANGIVVEQSTVPWVAHNDSSEGGVFGKVLLDLNGDGLPDAVEYPSLNLVNYSSTYFVNTGRGMHGWLANFAYPTKVEDQIHKGSWGAPDQYIVLDANQDGRDDIISAPVYPGNEPKPLRLFLSNGQGLNHSTTVSSGGQAGGEPIKWLSPIRSTWFRSVDADGDGLGDFMMEDSFGDVNLYLHDGKKADMITAFHSGAGATTKVTYSPWHESASGKGAGCGYPVQCPKGGVWVVSEHHVELDAGQQLMKTEYAYSRAALDMLGRGWLGFGLRTVTDKASGSVTEYTAYNTTRVGTSYPFAYRSSMTVRKSVLEDGTELTSSNYIHHDIVNGTAATAGRAFAVGPTFGLLTDTEKPAGQSAAKTLREIYSTTTYDEMGNVKKVERTGVFEKTKDSVEFGRLNDVTNWILSPVTSKIMTSTTPTETATRTTRYEYDKALPRLLKKTIVEPDGSDMDYLELRIDRRSKFGLPEVVSAVSRGGLVRTESVAYDDVEGSKPSVRTNALGHVSRTVYHPGLNLPLTEVDQNGLVTESFYYPFGRVQSVVPPDENAVVFGYTAPTDVTGGVVEVRSSLASGELASRALDALGREILERSKTANGKVAIQKTEYDPRFPGSVSAVSIPRFAGDDSPDVFTRITYDAAGRLRTVTAGDGRKGEVTYSGPWVKTRDPMGRESAVRLDGLGRVIDSVQKKSAADTGGLRELVLNYYYGPFGVLRQIVDDFENIIEMQYDVRGRKRWISDPDAGRTDLIYNAFGDTIWAYNGYGATNYDPDPLGRPKTVKSKDGTATFVWDKAPHGIGMLESAISADGVKELYTYDGLSRLASTTWSIDGESYSVGQSYDGFGRPDVLTYPWTPGWSAFSTQYHYGESGDLTSLTNASTGKLLWRLGDVYASGETKLEEFGNGVVSSYDFDEMLGAATGVTTRFGSKKLQALSYSYYDDLNVKTRTDGLSGLQELFEYDSLDRLKTWKETGSHGWSVTYSHSDLGNLSGRALRSSDGVVREELAFEHGENGAGPHAVSGSPWGSYRYDRVGNQTSSPLGTIEYTAFNLPKRIFGNASSEFSYSASGSRVTKKSSDGRTVYVGGLYEQRSRAGKMSHVLKLEAGGKVIGQMVREGSDGSEKVTYIHRDLLGSTDLLSDELGNVIGPQRKYDPFGNPVDTGLPKLMPGEQLASSDVHMGFAGHEEDSETGLTNMIGRMYDPRVGHFLTPDPFVHDPLAAISLSRYAYVHNNPINYTDASGLEELSCNGRVDCSEIQCDEDYVNGDRAPVFKQNYVSGQIWGSSLGGKGTPEGFQAWSRAYYGDTPRSIHPWDWVPGQNGVVESYRGGLRYLERRYPGGGVESQSNPGRVAVHFRDGSVGNFDYYDYVEKYELPYGQVTPADTARVDYNRQFVDDQWDKVSRNPKFVTPASPGQSANQGHLNDTSGRGRGLSGFSIFRDDQYGSGAANGLGEGFNSNFGNSSPEDLLLSVAIPIVGKRLGPVVKDGAKNLLRGLVKGVARLLPSNARRTSNVAEVFKRLARYHGIEEATASERLHQIKHGTGRGGADNVIFDLTGNVYDESGRWLGSLTEGGKKLR